MSELELDGYGSELELDGKVSALDELDPLEVLCVEVEDEDDRELVVLELLVELSEVELLELSEVELDEFCAAVLELDELELELLLLEEFDELLELTSIGGTGCTLSSENVIRRFLLSAVDQAQTVCRVMFPFSVLHSCRLATATPPTVRGASSSPSIGGTVGVPKPTKIAVSD